MNRSARGVFEIEGVVAAEFIPIRLLKELIRVHLFSNAQNIDNRPARLRKPTCQNPVKGLFCASQT
ncbi:MAG: hypothetical protein ACE5NG_14545 [bacterium]